MPGCITGFLLFVNMRKINFNPLPLLLTIFLLSCHGHRPVTTIETSNGNDFIKIRYNGTVNFSHDSTTIEDMSPMSTLSYRNNTDYLIVRSNEKGQLSFEITENGKSLLLDQKGKEFIAKAVKTMIVQGVGASR